MDPVFKSFYSFYPLRSLLLLAAYLQQRNIERENVETGNFNKYQYYAARGIFVRLWMIDKKRLVCTTDAK